MTTVRTSTLPQDLLQAFAGTEYHVEVEGQLFVVRVGRRHPGLDAALNEREWTILTAFNPGGEAHDDTGNAQHARELEARVHDRQWRHYPAVNRDPAAAWPDEPGLLVVEADPRSVDELARSFGQAATVAGQPGARACLRLYGSGWPQPLPHWARPGC